MSDAFATRTRAIPGTFWPMMLGAGAAIMWSVRTIALRGASGLMEVVAAAAAPVLGWLTWARPSLFPYGLYLLFAPLDVLTQINPREGSIARLIGLAAGAALLLYAVRTRSIRTPPRAIVWIALLCGWAALSTLWSIGPKPGLEASTLLQLGVLYLIVAIFPTRRGDLVPLLGLILLSGIVTATIGVYEFHAGGIQQQQSLQDFHRLNITLGQDHIDPNMYGDSLLLPFGVAFAWFARAQRWSWRLVAMAAMAFMLVALALTASRDALIGMAIVTVMLSVMLGNWKRLLPPAAALIAVIIAIYPNVIARIAADQGNGGAGRTSIWRVGFTAFLHHPFVGTGIGSYASTYDHWYISVYERIDPGWGMASHDIVLHYGVELGIVGLVLVFGWCIAQWLLARALPRAGLIGDVRAICLASLAALGFAAFFIDLFDVKFVWLVFGLIAQVRNIALFGDR